MESFNPDVIAIPQANKPAYFPPPTCVFSVVFEKDAAASEKAGRPVGKTKEIVSVQFQGSKDWTPWEVTDRLWATVRAKCNCDIEPLYRVWKQGKGAEAAQGTALAWVSVLSGSQVAGLNAIGVRTLEQLLEVNPEDLSCLGPEGPEAARVAKRWAKASDKNTDKQILLKQVEELQREVKEVRSQLANVNNLYMQATGKTALS